MGEVLTVFLGVVGAGVIGLDATAPGAGDGVVRPLLATQLLWSVVQTGGVTALVTLMKFTCFNARSDTASAFKHLFVNPWLWGAVALSVLLQVAVVHTRFLNVAFGTGPLGIDQWLICVAMASVVRCFSEGRKLVNRALDR